MLTLSSTDAINSVAHANARAGFQAPAPPLLAPPARCGKCGGAVMAKLMEGIAMLRAGMESIPYRCCACAWEVFVKIELPDRDAVAPFVWSGSRESGFLLDRDCPVCKEPLGLCNTTNQKYHRGACQSKAKQQATGSRWNRGEIKELLALWKAGETPKEIAERLGIPPSTVEPLVSAFRRRGWHFPYRKTGGHRLGGWTNPLRGVMG